MSVVPRKTATPWSFFNIFRSTDSYRSTGKQRISIREHRGGLSDRRDPNSSNNSNDSVKQENMVVLTQASLALLREAMKIVPDFDGKCESLGRHIAGVE